MAEDCFVGAHSVQIGVASDAEIAALIGDVDASGQVKGAVDQWHLVAIRGAGETTIHVIGHCGTSRRWMTSPVAVLSPDREMVRTRNSLYRLLTAAAGDLGYDTLLAIVLAGVRNPDGDARGFKDHLGRIIGHA